MQNTKRITFILGCGFLCLLLSGCFGPKYVEKKQYLFSIPPITKERTQVGKRKVWLNPIQAQAPFDSAYFIYRLDEHKYTVDYYNSFLTAPTTQLTNNFISYCRTNGNFYPMTEVSVASKYQLTIKLTRLFADYRQRNQPQAIMSLHLLLRKNQSHTILLDKEFNAQTVLKNKTSDALIDAWNTDMNILLQQITQTINKILK